MASHFFDPGGFSFTESLCRQWHAARAEALALAPSDFDLWPEREINPDGGWKVFGLKAGGRLLPANRARCPRTAALIDGVPGLTTAGFSRLAGGARIPPHHGYTGDVLRCHLGLVVPPGCGLRVGGETRHWAEGQCLVFDDTAEHEAWNDSDQPRLVLLLDFLRPEAALRWLDAIS